MAVINNKRANIADVLEEIKHCPECGEKCTTAQRARYSAEQLRNESVLAFHSLGFYLYTFYKESQVPPPGLDS